MKTANIHDRWRQSQKKILLDWLISANALLDNFVKTSLTILRSENLGKLLKWKEFSRLPVTGDDYKWHMRTDKEGIVVFFFFFLGVGGGTTHYSVIGYSQQYADIKHAR